MRDMEVIFLVEEALEGGYEACALGYSIYTQAESMEELREMVRDAVRCHFKGRGTAPFLVARRGGAKALGGE